MFKHETSQNTKLSAVFNSDENINTQTEKCIKLLNKCFHRSFRKVKVTNIKETEYEKLYYKWVQTKEKEDRNSKN